MKSEDDARTGYFMQTGIMEYDELQVYGRIEEFETRTSVQ